MIVVVVDCQRCGMTHVLNFKPLDNPVDEYNWWTMCPTKQQPILMQVTDENEESNAG